MTDPIDQLKANARASWGESSYAALSERLRPAAAELVRAAGIGPGMRVLDVAAGDGNGAVEALRAGAEAVASDLAPMQVEQGRQRVAAEGLDIEWFEADAEDLPFAEGEFDAVTSVFGAMFAPRPERVAAELFRVVRPGGTVAMANWRPEGFQARFFQTMDKFRGPAPEGVPPPPLWGVEEVVRERLGPYAAEVRVEPAAVPWRFESVQAMAEFFQKSSPRPSSVPEEKRGALLAELRELVNEFNRGEGGAVAIDAAYSIVVARKR
ncbi:MAG TPA: methyltransferase domain-containing protein [Thermoleophilaceae bacterium]|nr:methyltransferase domain-containing protein [Thermoleophilaceae bacterium]